MPNYRQESNGDELESRLREVLREVVRIYVSSGEPVSSRTLAKSGAFQLSPASLRNVMADLEDLGYLHQPHTSAGRVPTDRGYRFFINHLMRSRRLTSHEREVIDGEVAKIGELDDVMHMTSRLLSKLSDQVGLVFMPTLRHIAMRSIDLILVAERRLMVVIVATNGVVVNRVIEIDDVLTREEAEGIGRHLSAEFVGLTLAQIRERLVTLMREERARFDRMWRRTLAVGAGAVEELLPSEHEIWVEGASSILSKPEFASADGEAMRKVLRAFEEKEKLVQILNHCLGEEGLQVVVGSESPFTGSYNFALVATSYGMIQPAGLVAVIGPTRMEYSRVLPLVEYLGKALGRKIEESSGESVP
ncbi:MAG TPA: heat-inducible transcriptional repressor HrcA [Thermoanaerobaculia bacterium]|nr:heat-inducible transcriptional repressor HrcA [Thermoanaerobaculia bacterium]